jgi:hypothetical protein
LSKTPPKPTSKALIPLNSPTENSRVGLKPGLGNYSFVEVKRGRSPLSVIQ